MADPAEELSIVALDAHGEGVAANGAIVPGALPGERALVRLAGKRAELVEISRAAPERAEPICPWYGRCGGCAAQHMSDRLYRQWKRGLVVEALKREGVAAEVGELVDAHGAGRRRATFHARFPHGQADEVGFMRVRSHDIVVVDDCPLFSPGMAGAIAAARALSGDLRGLMKPIDIGVTATLDGLDVDLRGSGALERAEAQKLARTADALDLARVSNHGEIVIERRPPRVAFGEALVKLPPGGFLQATEAGETLLAEFAERALAELEAGRGSLLRRRRLCAEARPPARGVRRRRRRGRHRGAHARDRDDAGLAQARRRDARSFPPSAESRRSRCVRRGAHRSATRRGARAVARARRIHSAAGCVDLLQRGDLRPRRALSRRRRLSDRGGDAA